MGWEGWVQLSKFRCVTVGACVTLLERCTEVTTKSLPHMLVIDFQFET